MTISSTTNRVNYTGNGVTTAFAFGYKFLLNADLKVYQDGTIKTITTHYTVAGAGDDAGGTVTFLSAPANGEEVVILRDPAVTQGLDLVENDPLPAEDVEDAFDKLTMIAQRLDDRLDRAIVLDDTDTSGASLVLPSPVGDEVIKWNAAGDGLESATIAELGAVSIPVPIAQGGTASTTAAGARTALGLAIGVDVQAYDATILVDADIGVNVQAYDADTAKIDVAQNFTAPQRAALTTDNDGNFDLSVNQNFKCTTSGNTTITLSNQADGESGSVIWTTGSGHTISAHANTKITTSALTKLNTAGTYRIDYISDGTNAYCSVEGPY